MKKLGTIFKEVSERIVKENFKNSEGVFVIKYSKVSGPDMNNLRLSLKGAGGKFFAVKNSVARRALKDSGAEFMANAIGGACGLVFVKEEPQITSKILFDFAKDHAALKLECGLVENRQLDDKGIEALAKLPSKEALKAELVAVLNSPLSRCVMVLKKNLNTLVYCLEQKQKK